MSLTTSYFAILGEVEGRRISISRFNHPRTLAHVDEILRSFAPSIPLLTRYKGGKMGWPEYVRRYTEEQRAHYQETKGDFDELLKTAEHRRIVLACYERFEGPETKCHRILLYNMLKKVAARRDFDVKFIDEEIRTRR
mgnify:CR=1 FL=1